MGRWTIKPSCLFVLMTLLFLIVLILVLPEVDLPDTAFHHGTAPADVHARVTSAPGWFSLGTTGAVFFLQSHSIPPPRALPGVCSFEF
jgi:hypothetical protein